MNVELTPAVLLAAVVLADNRLTEFVKRALINNTKWSDDVQGAFVLFISFLVGVVAVLLLPGINMFGSVASSPFAAAIIQGVAIAGLANGVDFFASKVNDAADKLTDSTATDGA